MLHYVMTYKPGIISYPTHNCSIIWGTWPHLSLLYQTSPYFTSL